jgi:hypothetical protein
MHTVSYPSGRWSGCAPLIDCADQTALLNVESQPAEVALEHRLAAIERAVERQDYRTAAKLSYQAARLSAELGKVK